MTVWSNSRADIFYYNDDADCGDPCEVKIDNGRIVVSYEDEGGGYIVYEGSENGAGHFELSAPSVNGRATLHMFNGNKVLEGWWDEEGTRGMWRIFLRE